MNNQQNNRGTEKRAMPFFVEFVKFASGFVFIVAIALITLSFVTG